MVLRQRHGLYQTLLVRTLRLDAPSGALSVLAGGEEPRPAGQVAVVARLDPAELLEEDALHCPALLIRVLHRQPAARPQQPVRGALERADHVETVLAGEQGEL